MGLQAFIASFTIIAVAELGDKTQLLTLGFATKYPRWEVLSAILAATGALMALAVIFGQAIISYVPGFYIQFLASIIFITFGIWTILAKKEEEEKDKGIKTGKSLSPFIFIFSSFFLAELGDKTQLATLALAARYGSPLAVWLGATLGMVGVNIIALFVGSWLKDHVSEKTIKWAGALIFIGFGLWTLCRLIFSQF